MLGRELHDQLGQSLVGVSAIWGDRTSGISHRDLGFLPMGDGVHGAQSELDPRRVSFMKPLRVLMFDGAAIDAAMVVEELERAGRSIEYEQVATTAAMRAALERSPWDVVIADRAMPTLGGRVALDLLEKLQLDLPFLVVPGPIDPEHTLAALRDGATERRMRQMIESARVGIWFSAAEGKTSFINQRMAQILGLSAEEAQRASIEDFVFAVQLDLAEPTASRERMFRRKDGTVGWGLIESNRLDDPEGSFEGVLTVMTDISEQRSSHEAEREAELRFKRLCDSGIIGVSVSDLSGHVIDANDALLELVGYTRDELRDGTVSWIEMTPVEWRPTSFAARQEALGGRSVRPFEKEFCHKDGTRVPVLVGIALLDHDRFLTVVTDLTDRNLAEDRKAAVVDTALDAVVGMDHAGTITEFNPAAEQTFGFTRADVLGRSLANLLIPPRFRASHASGLERYLATGESQILGKRIEMTALRHDGSETPVELSVSRVGSGKTPSFVAFIRDISDRKRVEHANVALEEQLRQSQKMDALGRLAGGVAHDFNNMLSVVLSYSDMILEDLNEGDPIREDIEQIHVAAKRATDLTRQLLTFSRQQVIEPRVLDLNDVLVRMDKMLQRVVGEDVELTSIPDPSLGRVRVDPGSIEQVIMNLVVNARDAMPKGGKLTMETANLVIDEEFARIHLGAKLGAHVMLAVTDTGTGMDKATQTRIFEPFFTTKQTGKGTGLGLANVFGIVQQSNGNIWVNSQLGVGTTFRNYLPRVDAIAEDTRPSRAPTTLRGSETILLVEDENQVREVARGILRRHGYAVIEARNAGEALLSCERHPDAIHLLLTDVVMPQMSGPELANRLRQVRPEMKVLFMSGYIDDATLRHGVSDPDHAYLQKPITVESLTRRVREVLDHVTARQRKGH